MHTLELTNSKQDIQTAGKLLKDGELALKGLNRNSFEDILLKNIREIMEETA